MNEERLSDDELRRWLVEDVPHGDLTTRSLGLLDVRGALTFRARRAMRVALVEEAVRLFELCGAVAHAEARSGHDAAPGALLLTAQGPASALFAGWKVAQTAMEAGGGMATEAAHIIGLLKAAGCLRPLACTRKTMPGARGLARRAVTAGGAVMHRLGLSETLLVFPEHRLYLEDVPAALSALRAAQPEKRLVVEVGTPEEALSCARAGAEVLQLERFSPADLARLKLQLSAAALMPLLAPAGGVTAANAADYARAGADFLVTSAPYLAPPTDVRVTFEKAS